MSIFATIKAILETKAEILKVSKMLADLEKYQAINEITYRPMGYDGGYSPVIEGNSTQVLDYLYLPYADQETISREIFAALTGGEAQDFGFLNICVEYASGDLFQLNYDFTADEWDINRFGEETKSMKTSREAVAYVQSCLNG